MYRANSSRSFGVSSFRRPTSKKIFLLIMVPLLVLFIRYRVSKDSSQGAQWPSKYMAADEAAQPVQPVQPAPAKNRLDELLEEEKLSEQSRPEKNPLAEMAEEGGWQEVNDAQYNRLSQDSDTVFIHPHNGPEDVTVVAATAGPEDTSWIDEFCTDFGCTSRIYSLDEHPFMDHYLPTYSRKGHEASAYLTYIIDYYDDLSPYTLFIHGRTDQWHNDIAGPHTRNILPNLRFEAVAMKGYVNLRCMNRPGCPSTLFQAHPVTLDYDYVYLIDQLPRILNEMLGTAEEDVPDDFGHQCCAQFALSRERIRQRPRSDYIRILNWIATTDMTDNYGIGWMIEKLWHYIFGMPAVHCLSEEQCRCDLYGWCGPNPMTGGRTLTPIGAE